MSRPDPVTAPAHVIVINRWREHYAEYAEYLDHASHHVTYISTEVGLGSVPATATDVEIVDATDDLDQVRTAAAALVGRHGIPDRIVALKEDDLLVGAQLRVDYGVVGDRPENLLVFRDKLAMCRAIAEAGLPVPRFTVAADLFDIRAMGERVGWPLVLKPRIGSSSAGVTVLSGPAELDALAPPTVPMLVQEFNPHPIHHVDGVFTPSGLLACKVSRYVNTCLGFREGTFLGSVEEDDPEVVAAVEAAATDFLGALTRSSVPFHLEVFVSTGEAGVSCSFLEVAPGSAARRSPCCGANCTAGT
ncbi:acetyl-CoA carboxylase biotin carboxylase subunit family protein [Saccharomonospora sp. CUA-673]|uniref:ATP-grasp domain-containing protein n=1 Tax=Saccharomonospora sp. CUA-673 TaxID=1904969 RepID=UPI001C9E3CA9|nr:ATP-grasp domain-containing protein [Saccharomonospora sp. CUA-673]